MSVRRIGISFSPNPLDDWSLYPLSFPRMKDSCYENKHTTIQSTSERQHKEEQASLGGRLILSEARLLSPSLVALSSRAPLCPCDRQPFYPRPPRFSFRGSILSKRALSPYRSQPTLSTPPRKPRPDARFTPDGRRLPKGDQSLASLLPSCTPPSPPTSPLNRLHRTCLYSSFRTSGRYYEVGEGRNEARRGGGGRARRVCFCLRGGKPEEGCTETAARSASHGPGPHGSRLSPRGLSLAGETRHAFSWGRGEKVLGKERSRRTPLRSSSEASNLPSSVAPLTGLVQLLTVGLSAFSRSGSRTRTSVGSLERSHPKRLVGLRARRSSTCSSWMRQARCVCLLFRSATPLTVLTMVLLVRRRCRTTRSPSLSHP